MKAHEWELPVVYWVETPESSEDLLDWFLDFDSQGKKDIFWDFMNYEGLDPYIKLYLSYVEEIDISIYSLNLSEQLKKKLREFFLEKTVPVYGGTRWATYVYKDRNLI